MIAKSHFWLYLIFICGVALASGPILLALYNNTKTFEGKILEAPAAIDPIDQSVANFDFESEKQKLLEPDSEFYIKSCNVIDGYRFKMRLEDNHEITANLTTATKDDATSVVIDLLGKNKDTRPSVLLRRKAGDNWIVDVFILIDGKRTNLVEALRTKGLTF